MDYYCFGCGALNVVHPDSSPLIYCWNCRATGFSTETQEDPGIVAAEDEERAKGQFRGGL